MSPPFLPPPHPVKPLSCSSNTGISVASLPSLASERILEGNVCVMETQKWGDRAGRQKLSAPSGLYALPTSTSCPRPGGAGSAEGRGAVLCSISSLPIQTPRHPSSFPPCFSLLVRQTVIDGDTWGTEMNSGQRPP